MPSNIYSHRRIRLATGLAEISRPRTGYAKHSRGASLKVRAKLNTRWKHAGLEVRAKLNTRGKRAGLEVRAKPNTRGKCAGLKGPETYLLEPVAKANCENSKLAHGSSNKVNAEMLSEKICI